MSAKRSWDVRRDGSRAGRVSKKGSARSRESLAVKRKRAKGNAFLFVLVVCVLLAGGVIYGLWRNEVRIQEVITDGEYATNIEQLASQKMQGRYFYLIPRDSIFFYPEEEIRISILKTRPELSAVSISRSGLTSLHISTVRRLTAFWWCGTPSFGAAIDDTCYEADIEGFVFAPAHVATTSAIASSTLLRIYSELSSSSTTDSYPLRLYMKNLEAVPDILQFAKAMRSLNLSIASIAIREDEADLYLGSGTRVTYVVGREEDAAALAAASFPSLNLTDGSIEYVDLRFNGKAYVKRRE